LRIYYPALWQHWICDLFNAIDIPICKRAIIGLVSRDIHGLKWIITL